MEGKLRRDSDGNGMSFGVVLEFAEYPEGGGKRKLG